LAVDYINPAALIGERAWGETRLRYARQRSREAIREVTHLPQLGFIGLGNRGEPMARNLLRAGYGLRVRNRRRVKAARLAEEGAELAAQCADLAEPGGIVLSMLADDHAVEEVCFAQPCFVGHLGTGGIHISLGRISPETARRLALGLQDINLILSAAAKNLTPVPLASLLHDRSLSSMAKGRSNLDWSAIILDLTEQAGINTMSAAS